MNDHLFGEELFIRFTASAFRKLPSFYVFSYFPFGFEGRIWDLIVSAPDHCLSFYSDDISTEILKAAYDIISPQLVKLFNSVFNDAEYPENWTLGYIIPIFKDGDSINAKTIAV